MGARRRVGLWLVASVAMLAVLLYLALTGGGPISDQLGEATASQPSRTFVPLATGTFAPGADARALREAMKSEAFEAGWRDGYWPKAAWESIDLRPDEEVFARDRSSLPCVMVEVIVVASDAAHRVTGARGAVFERACLWQRSAP